MPYEPLRLHREPSPSAPEPAEIASAPAPLSPARSALRSAILAVSAASAGFAKAQEPIQRLTGLIAEHDSLTRKLADLRDFEEERLTAWLIAGSAGPRPVPAQEIVEIERELQIGSADQVAAKKALESLQPEAARAADRVRACHQQRDQAVHSAALEVCCAYIADRYEPALQAALAIECALRSVVLALRAKGSVSPPDTSALAAASQVEEAIATTKRDVGIRLDPASGQRLLDRLMTDASAELA
jgi:hypothetical protein